MLHAEGPWQESRVASVAAVDARDEVLKVQHRARFLNCADFGWQLLFLARQVGYHRAACRVFLADGARWLWELADLHFPDAIQILDWYHLVEHVHESAAVLFGEGSPNARRWSESRRPLQTGGHAELDPTWGRRRPSPPRGPANQRL